MIGVKYPPINTNRFNINKIFKPVKLFKQCLRPGRPFIVGYRKTWIVLKYYRMAHEKPARLLVEQHGRRSRTLYRKLNKCKCKVLTGQRRCWKLSPCTSMHFCARCSLLSHTRCNSAVSIRRIDTAELHRVCDNKLQRTQKCIDVQGDNFQHLLWPVSTLHLHLFNFLYRVRDLRPRWSTRRRAGFSYDIL